MPTGTKRARETGIFELEAGGPGRARPWREIGDEKRLVVESS